jgi:hypothetical protein
MKLKDRIRTHFQTGITYRELLDLVYPWEEYPDSRRRSMNGGPPGCAMAFGRALRELGLRREWKTDIVHKTQACEF